MVTTAQMNREHTVACSMVVYKPIITKLDRHSYNRA